MPEASRAFYASEVDRTSSITMFLMTFYVLKIQGVLVFEARSTLIPFYFDCMQNSAPFMVNPLYTQLIYNSYGAHLLH